MTPHINAEKGAIAKTVLMPGDPLRAQYIAKTYLTDVKLVSDVRNILMFTGKYNGKEVTVAASGMGCPSMGIYSYELFKFYDVEAIIRIGSAGAYEKDLKLYSTLLATQAYSDSTSFSELVTREKTNIAYPSEILNNKLIEAAKNLNIDIETGRIHSSDVFYATRDLTTTIKLTQARAVEMESYALFINAKLLNKKAACLLTISDNLITKEETTALERQNSFNDMMKIALEAA